jgi:hypothetical protein
LTFRRLPHDTTRGEADEYAGEGSAEEKIA